MKRDAKIQAPPVMMRTYIVKCYEDGVLKCTQAFPSIEEAEEALDAWCSVAPSRTAERETETDARKLR